MGFRGGGVKLPPSTSWFSSTPAEIGLKNKEKNKIVFEGFVVLQTFISGFPLNHKLINILNIIHIFQRKELK